MEIPTRNYTMQARFLLTPFTFAIVGHHHYSFLRRFYSKMWDERYSEDGFVYGTEPNDFLRETFPTLEWSDPNQTTRSCLLLAEGEGRNAVFVAEQAGWKATGVDASSVGLAKAEQLARTRGVEIRTVVADLATFDLGVGQWDCIVGISCHLPPPIRARVLDCIPTALAPGGYFVLEGYTPKQLEFKTGGPSDESFLYSSKILQESLQGSLDILKNEELERDVVEGKYHVGRAAVVQFIGRKPFTAT